MTPRSPRRGAAVPSLRTSEDRALPPRVEEHQACGADSPEAAVASRVWVAADLAVADGLERHRLATGNSLQEEQAVVEADGASD